jgi:Na+/glutamate symporter
MAIFVYLLYDLVILIPCAVVAGIFVLVQKRFAVKPRTGFTLTSLTIAIFFAIIGSYTAHTLLSRIWKPDPLILTIVYSVVGLGILYGAVLGIPLYNHIRKFAYPDEETPRANTLFAFLPWLILISTGLCCITLFFFTLSSWTGD